MMPTLAIALFPHAKRPTNQEEMTFARLTLMSILTWLVRHNERLLKRGWVEVKGRRVSIPPLYSAGVRYVREPGKREEWQDIQTTLARREGDCEDLAAWRTAELRAQGVQAHPLIQYRLGPAGQQLMHALVELPGGKIEDPSRRLGM